MSATRFVLLPVLVNLLFFNGPSAKSAECQIAKVATLPVTLTPSNQILIDGSIKGQPTRFLVDTGAGDTPFDSSVFSRFWIA